MASAAQWGSDGWAALELPAVGTVFPDLAFTDATDARVTLWDFTSQRRSLVYFMRTPTCPVCNAHLQQIARMVAAGELANVSVVIVVPGEAADVALVAGTIAPGVATVVATGPESRAAVGFTKFLMLAHSGSFVLDAAGRVLVQRFATVPRTSFVRAEVLAALAESGSKLSTSALNLGSFVGGP